MSVRAQPEIITAPMTARTLESVNICFEYLFKDVKLLEATVTATITSLGTALTPVAGGVCYSTSAALALTAAGTTGQLLQSAGSGTPTWTSDLLTSLTIGTKYIYRADGTDVSVADGGTGKSSWAVGDIVHATGTGTLAGLADVATGQVLASGGVGAIAAWTASPSVTNITVTGLVTGNTQNFVDISRFGFLNQTETTIAFDGTSVFTLGSVGASWSYYRSGLKYTISGSKTVDLLTVENPLVDGRLYYIYIDGTLGTLVAAVSGWTLTDTKVPIATVLWNNTLTPKYWLAEERHSCLIDRRIHYYEHFTSGTKAITAGALSGQVVNSDVNADKTCGIAITTIADEDLLLSLAALTDPNGTATDYVALYRTGAATWAWKASNMPFVYNVGNTNDWIQWDNGGTMTDATGGGGATARFLNSYLLFTNMVGAARFVFTPGRAIYTSLAAAQAEAPSSFVWTGFPIAEAVIAYRLTWTTVTSTSQGQCRLAATPQAVNLGAISAIGTGASIDHNTLSGLQGGTASQYYHLTATEYATMLTEG